MKPELRLVTPQGHLAQPLPDYGRIEYLDDDNDVGALVFEYPDDGRFADLLDFDGKRVEVALLADGKELPNGRFVLEEFSGNTITDGTKPMRTWSGPSLLGRLDEALVVPEHDEHLREDVYTQDEREEYREKRREWYEQQVKAAVREAKEAAEAHNDQVRERRKGGDKGGADQDPDNNPDVQDLNRWGKHAIRWATKQIDNPSQNWYRMCQSFVRQSYGLDGIYGTAIEAWRAGRKRGNTPFNETPAGVPVYWAPNHVALSIGGGDCISTDVLRAGNVDIVPIASLSNGVHWSLTYLGWSPDCSGVRIFP